MKSFLLAAATSLIFGGLASAAALIVPCSVEASVTELNGNISCPNFGLAQALISVQISVVGTINGSITLTNGNATTQTVVGQLTSTFNVTGLAGFVLTNPIFSLTYNTGAQGLTPGQTRTITGLTANNGPAGASIGTTTNVAGYQGAGSFVIPVTTSTVLKSQAGIGLNHSTGASVTALVTYNYDPGSPVIPPGGIPSPATSVTLAVGLISCALLRIRQVRGTH